MAFCSHCGRPVNAGASFCSSCGASVAPVAAPPPMPAPVLPSETPPPAATMAAPAPAAPLAPGQGPRPLGITIIGIVMMVGAAFMAVAIGGLLIAAFAFGMMGSAFDMAFPWMEGMPGMAAGIMVGVFLIVALFMAAFAALAVATAIGVLKGKPWAWAMSLVVFGLIALNGLGSLADQDWGGVLGLIVAGLCIWYYFQPEAKRWFGRS